MSKRVLQVIDSLGTGGAETVLLTLSNALLKQGHHVEIIIINEEVSYEIDARIKLYRLAFKKGFLDYYRYQKKLHQLVDTLQEDSPFDKIIVHLQQATRLMKGYHHSKLFNVVHSTLSQASLSNRQGIRRYLKVRRLKNIYDDLNIVTVSNGIARDIEDIGIEPKQLNVIYNPVDLEQLKYKAGLHNECIAGEAYIVHVGRLAQSKRHDRVLRSYALSKIKPALYIVGDGEMRQSIEKEIKNLGLKEHVKLCGFQSNPYPIIKNAKLLVLSSDYEGLPTVLIEALSLGIPVVSTDCPSGPREILGELMEESLIALDDDNAFSEAIKRNIEHPFIVPKDVAARFDSTLVVQQYIDL